MYSVHYVLRNIYLCACAIFIYVLAYNGRRNRQRLKKKKTSRNPTVLLTVKVSNNGTVKIIGSEERVGSIWVLEETIGFRTTRFDVWEYKSQDKSRPLPQFYQRLFFRNIFTQTWTLPRVSRREIYENSSVIPSKGMYLLGKIYGPRVNSVGPRFCGALDIIFCRVSVLKRKSFNAPPPILSCQLISHPQTYEYLKECNLFMVLSEVKKLL